MTASSRAVPFGFIALALAVSGRAAQSGPLRLDPSYSVGVAVGPEQDMFGIVVDVAADSRGYVYVLDRHEMHLSVYSPQGDFVAETGTTGQGPGEYGYASALERGEGDVVHAFDRRNARIYAYRLEERELMLVRTTRVPVWAMDFCVLDDTYYVLGYRPGGTGGIIHELAPDGTLERSFGAPFIRDPPGLELIDSGELACLPDVPGLLVAATQVPLVRRYGLDGELVWETTLDGFNRMTIEPIQGGVRMSAPESGGISDVSVAASDLGDGLALVQFGKATPDIGDPEAISDVVSVFLSLDTGREVERVEGLGKVEFADGERLLQVTADPFPRVAVYRYEVDPDSAR